jgi:cysteine desulfurase
MEEEAERLAGLRDGLYRALSGSLDGVHLNGAPENRLPGNLNVSFEGVRAHRLLGALTTLAVSSSSACASGSTSPSAVLRNIGVPDDLAAASLRIGLGRFTTDEEIDFAAEAIIGAVRKIRDEG